MSGSTERMAKIRPFYVMELLARAKQLEAEGRSVIHMEVGEPDFDSPAPVVRAGQQALADGLTHYTPAMGIAPLREAIARHYLTRYGVEVDLGRVVVTPGSSGALQLVMSVMINPGDKVMMADPSYPCNRNFVYLVGGDICALAVGHETNYQLTAELVEKNWTEDTRAVMVATPSNPTGTLIEKEELRRIHQVVRDRGGVLIVDEIYQGLVYSDESYTALEFADDLFVINSFSKYFGMTGWRLGWVIAPQARISDIDKLAQNIFLSAPTPAQYAALEAFSDESIAVLEQRRLAFQKRRDYLYPALTGLGFKIHSTPKGAFYLYADCSAFTLDSYQFSMTLLEQEGVAITPGRDFGDNRPQTHVRFAYTTDLPALQEGVKRIARFIGHARAC